MAPGTSVQPASPLGGSAEVAGSPQVSGLPDLLPRALPDDPMAVTIHRLDNGLTVYISTDRDQPRISAQIAVRAGSRHDPEHSTGLAHYLEHMLFKGTEKLGTVDAAAERPHLQRIRGLYAALHAERDEGRRRALLADIDRETQTAAQWVVPSELERLYTRLGAKGLNAFTSDDSTRYVVDLPSNRLDQWSVIEAERLSRPSFRLFLHELEAVYEELNSTLDSPEERGVDTLMSLLYPAHPYGRQNTIGRPEHLLNPAFQDMVDYFQRWYVPNNMAIVLAGDIDADTALPVLRASFGGWSPRPLSPPEPGVLKPLVGRQFREIRAEIDEVALLAWQLPGASDADQIPLVMVDALLSQSTSGLLNTELVLPHKLNKAGSQLLISREASAFVVYGGARDGQSTAEVERLLLETVERLKRGQFADEDLAALALEREIADKRELESSEARATRMVDAFVEGMSWRQVVQRGRLLRQVTKQDVVRVANRYLGPGFAAVHRRKGKFQPPKLASPKVTPLELDDKRESPWAASLLAQPVKPIQPVWMEAGKHFHRGRLPAGTLLSARNARNDLFDLRYQFDVGSVQFPLLCHALALQQRSGAGELDGAGLRHKLFVLGATIEASCSPDETTITVEGIDENMEQVLALLDRWFRQPRFGPEDVAALLETTLTKRKTEVDDSRYGASALGEYAFKGAGSIPLQATSNRKLAEAKADELRRLLTSFPDQAHKTLYFGPRPPDRLAGSVAFGRNHRPLTGRRPRRYRTGGHAEVYVLDRQMSQAQLRVAFTDGPLRREDRTASIMLSEYLGDEGDGVVIGELRGATGLVYTANARHRWGDRRSDGVALTGVAMAQNDKANAALDRLVALLRRADVQPARLDEVKAKLDAQFRSTRPRPRRIVPLADAWEQFGEKTDPRPRYWAETLAMTPERLRAFWLRAVQRPLRVAVTGDLQALDRGRLAKLGKLRVMKAEELFGYGPFSTAKVSQAEAKPVH